MYRSSFRTFPSFLNPRAYSAHNTWANLWSFRGFSSKTQSSFIFSTITEQWKFSYRIFTYIQNEIYPFWMDPYKLWFHCPLTIQKSVSQKSQNRLFSIKKIYHKKSTPGNRIGVACTGRLICAFVVHIWQNRFSHDVTHFQIDRSYLCRIRKKEFVASNFTVKKKKQQQQKKKNKKKNNCWFTIVGVIFAEDFLKINLFWIRLYVWGTVPCDCWCSGQKLF